MLKKNRKRCTEKVYGVISEVRVTGLESSTVISAAYYVGGIYYSARETLKLKSEPIKAGIFTIGLRRIPVIGHVEMGTEVTVCYNPENPKEAYILENTGKSSI